MRAHFDEQNGKKERGMHWSREGDSIRVETRRFFNKEISQAARVVIIDNLNSSSSPLPNTLLPRLIFIR